MLRLSNRISFTLGSWVLINAGWYKADVGAPPRRQLSFMRARSGAP